MSCAVIEVQQATVYRGGGRRWFTRNAAIRAEARRLFGKRFRGMCECDTEPDIRYWAYVCRIHGATFRDRFVRRVARLIAAHDAEVNS